LRVLVVNGHREPGNVFALADPTEFAEVEFEAHVLGALALIYPEYHCLRFRGEFEFDGVVHQADLALVHATFSHWFVLEVELVSHSLYGHVVPQVRCLRYGTPLASCADRLTAGLPGLHREKAETLIRWVPRSVAVIANRKEPEWIAVLRGLDVQFVALSIFSGEGGGIAHESDGSLYVPKRSIGFFRYSASDRSIRVHRGCQLPIGTIQIEDTRGCAGLWTVRAAGDDLWLTKDAGDPGIPDGELLQILSTHAGRIVLSVPAKLA